MSRAALSVVVPSVNGSGDLDGALAALEAQGNPETLEILVVDRLGDDLREHVRRKFPRVRLLPVPTSATIPQMRAVAFAACTADAVAVIEDHVIVPRGWANALLGAMNGSRRVVGGSVENTATDRLSDWAAFLCEYSHCINPLPSGPSTWLTGNNVIYPKVLLDEFRAVIAEGAWENRLHDAMRNAGVALVCHPEIVVGHKKHFGVAEYLGQRYLYARSYAGARVEGRSLGPRLAYAAAAFALPPLLLWRTVSRVVSKRRHMGHLVRSLPLLALFVCAWAAGEVVGYARGAGDSLSRVR
ncbi:MAG: glycosyltransferase family 2 protein [Gemmatimonadaceae bacterium]